MCGLVRKPTIDGMGEIQREEPAAALPPHTPGAGYAMLRELWGDRMPETTPEDERLVDELIEKGRLMMRPPKRT